MNVDIVLMMRADDEAERLAAERTKAEAELLPLLVRVDQLRAAITDAELSRRRAKDYLPLIEDAYQCPRCWIVDGRQAIVATGARVAFVCEQCEQEYRFRAS